MGSKTQSYRTLSDASKEQLEREVITVFARGAQVLGLPKSVGSIYGILFLSPQPLSMDGIMDRLGISLGSASQGLRQLKSFKAVQAISIPGQRKDFYEAETEFRKLAFGFLREEVFPGLQSAADTARRVRPLLADIDDYAEHYRSRLDKLDRWSGLGSGFLKHSLKWIDF